MVRHLVYQGVAACSDDRGYVSAAVYSLIPKKRRRVINTPPDVPRVHYRGFPLIRTKPGCVDEARGGPRGLRYAQTHRAPLCNVHMRQRARMRRPASCVDLLAYQRIPLVRGTCARGKLRKRVTRQDAYWYWPITLVRGDESPRAPAAASLPRSI
jgi:hypothetical protein